MPPNELCEVVITAPDPDWLYAFSRQLVEDGLCASAHNFAPIRSIYRWRGEIYERAEGRVSLHTSLSRVREIVALAKSEHPYEVPGVSTRPITGGNPDYLDWIEQETTKQSAPMEIQEPGRPMGNRRRSPEAKLPPDTTDRRKPDAVEDNRLEPRSRERGMEERGRPDAL